MDARAAVVACFGRGDPQFAGAVKAMAELAVVSGFSVCVWEGGPLRFSEGEESSRRGIPADSLRRGIPAASFSIVIAGHGSEERAGLGNGSGLSLAPSVIAIPRSARLYLLGCYQGRDDLREQWVRGCGLPSEGVQGAEGETESLLSTLFLMHCAAEGAVAVGRIFTDWVLANRIVRPHFTAARRLYARTGGDPLAVLDFLQRTTDLSPVELFLSLARRRPEFLTGLLAAEGRL